MEKQQRSGWLIAFRILFTAALIGCIIFIFRNSMQNSELSSARSQQVMQTVNALLGKVGVGPLSEHIIRKLAHFAEYCLEGFWLMLCLRVYTVRFVRHISWPLLGGLLTALADETIQIFSAGRSSQVTDVWIDFAGVTAGLCAALILLVILHALWSNHQLRRENARLKKERQELQLRKVSHVARGAAPGYAAPERTAQNDTEEEPE